ncbi:MAG: NAD(P)-dependent oxidoreductase [Armatimonadota bacterium]|nr:NAD(P)-dependent oxidoreductase [Armatimonadota bacterium]
MQDISHLESLLSEPPGYVVVSLGKLEGDTIVLGAGGKMGPSLATMAKRASDMAGRRRRVIGVSRFSSGEEEAKLNAAGVETVRCDLLDPNQLAELPEVPNVAFMVGVKFGTSEQQARTWAANCYLPGAVCHKFRASRIVAFSTGNVYSMVPVETGGSVETDSPGPTGEYAMSALGRERVFEYFSDALGIPTAIIRLNYACEPRYGVLVDIARRVFEGEPVDLSMGYFNIIWQGDANAMSLAAFDHVSSPPFILNVAGPEILSVRSCAERFGELMAKEPIFTGTEAPDAFLSNAGKAFRLFGKPSVNAEQLISWIADWTTRGGKTLGKPTHFEARDGKY